MVISVTGVLIPQLRVEDRETRTEHMLLTSLITIHVTCEIHV